MQALGPVEDLLVRDVTNRSAARTSMPREESTGTNRGTPPAAATAVAVDPSAENLLFRCLTQLPVLRDGHHHRYHRAPMMDNVVGVTGGASQIRAQR